MKVYESESREGVYVLAQWDERAAQFTSDDIRRDCRPGVEYRYTYGRTVDALIRLGIRTYRSVGAAKASRSAGVA